MRMHVFLLGLSHQTAPVEVRERFSIGPAQLPRALSALRETAGAQEAAILSTCNRTEIYAVGEPKVARRLERLVGKYQILAPHSVPVSTLAACLYRNRDEQAAQHLFRVASGVESLVLGESEILGQVKVAHESALAQGAAGGVLDELFRRAIATGKRARQETAIGRGAMSVGSSSVELARQIFGPLKGHTILILGAGKISSLTARSLVASGAHEVIVANRTHQRACELASNLRQSGADAQAVLWDEIATRLVEADIVIASTRAPHEVLSAKQIETAMHRRKSRPLFLIDLAVPRDIDPSAHKIDDVFLYNIDDLKNVVETNHSSRLVEAQEVGHIIDSEVEQWRRWQKGLAAQPVAAALARRGATLREIETEIALAKLAHLPEADRETVKRLAHSLTSKLLHAPLAHLRQAGENGSEDVEAISRAFDLDAEMSLQTVNEKTRRENRS